MQNLVILAVVAVIAIGGVWLVTNSNDEATVDTVYDTETADTANEMDSMESEPMDTTEPSETEMSEATSEPDIVETAMETESLSTLVTAVGAAELVATLQGDGPFTVFAPTNAAFDALPSGTLDTLLEPANQASLQSVLTYHVVPGEVTAADLSDGMTVETVSGETLMINVGADGVTVNGSATVTTADVMTDNGVVHIIDSVLLPESMQ